MESLGQYLRSIREEKNLTLEAVYNDIKLSVELLTAIESDQLSKLGNYGFAKAMAFTYIRYLNADSKLAMNLFDLILPAQKKTVFKPQLPIKEKKVLISVNFIWLVVITLIVITLGSIILVSYSKGYLKRPTENLIKTEDSVTVKAKAVRKIETPDTLRTRMLQIANQVNKPRSPEKSNGNKIIKTKKTISDTADYVDEFIFDTKDSPFNSRF